MGIAQTQAEYMASIGVSNTHVDAYGRRPYQRALDAGYAVAEGPSYVELLLRPGAASGSMIIESVAPGFEPLLAVAGLSAALVCVAAGAYLFRRRSE
jgi:hypothetical protein